MIRLSHLKVGKAYLLLSLVIHGLIMAAILLTRSKPKSEPDLVPIKIIMTRP